MKPLKLLVLAMGFHALGAWADEAPVSSRTQPVPLACQSKDVLLQKSTPQNETSVDGLLRLAALEHPSIQSRLSEQASAQASVDSAKWGYFPSVSLTREKVNASSTAPSYLSTGSNAVSVVGVRQSLWTGGRLSSTKEKAQATLESRMYGSQEQKEAVAAQVLDIYASWLRTHRQLQSTDASIQVHKDLYEHVDHRIAGGVASEVDRELTLSRLRQLYVDRARLVAAKTASLYQLSQLVGRTLNESVLIQMADQERVLCLGEPQQMIDAAISRNPSIARLNAEIKAAEADVEIRKASRFPEVYARAERQYGNYSIANSTPENRVFVGLAYQPGAGLSLGSDVQALEVHKTALEQSLQASRLDLQRQYNNDWLDYGSLNERLSATAASLAGAKAVKESYERQYQAGRKSWFDVMNMAREQLQLELQKSDIEVTLLTQSRKLLLQAYGLNEWGL